MLAYISACEEQGGYILKVKKNCNLQKGIILKKIFGIIAVLGMIVTMGLSIHTTSYAYTEEEKAQAKAWLSAHGYSPDAAGASQAYQDYLNGKFDEELGITTESAQSSEATSETTTEAATSQQNTEPADGNEKKTGNEKSKDDPKSENGDTSSVSSGSEGETSSNEGSKDMESSSESVAEEEEKQQQDSNDIEEQEETEVSSEASDGPYREAFLVILLGVVCMLLVALFWRKK